MSDVVETEKEKADKSTTTIIYALYASGLLVGVTWIAAIILNYIKRGEIEGEFLQSHFRWQMRTFWYSLLWSVLGLILTIVIIGFFILAISWIWVIYRIVKGWMYLNENKPMYA